MSRPLLDPDAASAAAIAARTGFHASTVEEVRAAVAREKLVIVGMAWNPSVKKARNILTEQKLAFTYLEYGNYISGWRQRLAIKLWSGWPTFPQVYVQGRLIGGCSDLQAAIKDGTFQKLLESSHA